MKSKNNQSTTEINLIKVACIGLHRRNGKLLLNVPLYIKAGELNANGLTDNQAEIIDHVAEIMHRCYERQLQQYFASLKDQPWLTATQYGQWRRQPPCPWRV